jgi:hypothetical protein
MTTPNESRTFTTADFEPIRPGVFRLRDHHVYAAGVELKEPCEHCDGRGKTLATAAGGRKFYRPCGACYGRRLVNPLRNLEWGVPAPPWGVAARASSLEDLAASLNDDACGHLEHPTYVTLYG